MPGYQTLTYSRLQDPQCLLIPRQAMAMWVGVLQPEASSYHVRAYCMSPTILMSWQRSILYLGLRALNHQGQVRGELGGPVEVCAVHALQAEDSWLLPPVARPDKNHIEGFDTVCSNASDDVAKHRCKQGSRSQAACNIQTELCLHGSVVSWPGSNHYI